MSAGETAAASRSIAELVAALYASISGPAGAARDWALNESLFLPGAMIAVVRRSADGSVEVETLTTAEYQRTRDPFLVTHGFFERETRRHEAIHGALAHVVSEYESRWREDEAPFETGRNLLQLVNGPDGWRVAAISWESGIAVRMMRDGA